MQRSRSCIRKWDRTCFGDFRTSYIFYWTECVSDFPKSRKSLFCCRDRIWYTAFLYVLMIGFSVSVIRAAIMLLLRIGADMTGRSL